MGVAVISIHDVAPATLGECDHLVAIVESIDARASLLVIPGPWRVPVATEDPSFASWLLAASDRGHEIVAHGWEHRAVADPSYAVPTVRRAGERLLTRGCAEFAALGAEEARERAVRSLAALHELGASPTGFVAPGWSLSAAAEGVLADVGFGYTTTRRNVIDLIESRSIPIPAVCHRPGSALSAMAARMVVAVVEMRCRERRSIRLALHPDDVHDARLDSATQRAVHALDRSALDVVTYADVISSCRASVSVPIGSVR
jgi:hypothetical protein